MPSIVQTNVSQVIAPAPNTLQKKGAFISQGATSNAPGVYTLLTQDSDLTPILLTAQANTSIAWATEIATVTTTAAHNLPLNATLYVTIAGAVPSGYNGTFLATVTGADTFTVPIATNPGSETAAGTWINADVAELSADVSTFFGQGANQAVYVLELGPGSPANGVAYLGTWITNNPGFFYSYLVPRAWGDEPTYVTFLAAFEALNAKTYFFTTMTLANYASFTNLMKCVVGMVEAPLTGAYPANALTALTWTSGVVTATTTTAHGVAVGDWFTLNGSVPIGYNGIFQAQPGTTGSTLIYNLATDPGAETALGTLVASIYASAGVPSTEVSLAATFYDTLNYAPSSTNKVTPLSFTYQYGVTPYPLPGNNAILTALKTASVNYITTGAEGGISNTMVVWGTTMDGNPFNYWYSIDWMQINAQLVLANAVINGSNTPVSPLDYNQNGIDALQQVLVSFVNNAVAYGLVLFPPVQTSLSPTDLNTAINAGTYDGYTIVNAVPFVDWGKENPSDYSKGLYGGFYIGFTPLRGFENIIVNLAATQFVS